MKLRDSVVHPVRLESLTYLVLTRSRAVNYKTNRRIAQGSSRKPCWGMRSIGTPSVSSSATEFRPARQVQLLHWLKTPLRLLWRMAGPLRTPLVRKVDSHLARVVSDAVTTSLAELRDTVRELNLFSDNVARELVRLQVQVDSVRQFIEKPVGTRVGTPVEMPVEIPVEKQAAQGARSGHPHREAA